MTRIISLLAFALGACVVLWMATAFVAANGLALAVTLLIAAGYCVGFAELWRYQQASQTLESALAALPPALSELAPWLERLHPSLRDAVRQRVRGEQLGLPAPVLTPYLVGLLVMLGLLGTFIGMVATLQGAVSALEGSSELSAVRAGLAAPIQGLGMAFATSVAGVTASAMLGLIATLSRRQRLLASRRLDAEMAGAFQGLSLGQQRWETYRALQQQAEALPEVVARLDQLSQRLDASAHQLGQGLLAGQRDWQEVIEQRFTRLAESVERALQDTLSASVRRAGETLQPMLGDFMQAQVQGQLDLQRSLSEGFAGGLAELTSQFARASDALGDQWQQALATQTQRDAELSARWQQGFERLEQQVEQRGEAMVTALAHQGEHWLDCQKDLARTQAQNLQEAAQVLQHSAQSASAALLEEHQRSATQVGQQITDMVVRGDALLQAREQHEAQWQAAQQARFRELLEVVTERLSSLATLEQERSDRVIGQLEQLQTLAAERLAALGERLELPMQRLIETASETPRAAADVIAKLRSEMSSGIARDNALLEERQQLLGQLKLLTETLDSNSQRQAAAIDAMVAGGSQRLSATAAEFTAAVNEGAAQLQTQVDQFGASADELASLGDAFAAAVVQFGQSNQQLGQQLIAIEQALANSGQRSSEQMEYFLLQAREIIDHNLVSQQELLQQMQRLADGQALQA